MVGRAGLEPATNWLKAKQIPSNNLLVSQTYSIFFRARKNFFGACQVVDFIHANKAIGTSFLTKTRGIYHGFRKKAKDELLSIWLPT